MPQPQGLTPKPKPAPTPASQGGSKISGAEWGLVIGAVGVIDFFQFILDALWGAGVIINRFIDMIVAMSLLFYFWIRRVEMDFFVVGTLFGAFIGEEIPGLDAAPLWTLDVIAIMLHDRAKRAV